MAASRSGLLCISILSSIIGSVCGATQVSQKVQGAVPEIINASLFYQSYVPLILKFRVPDWSLDALRLNKTMNCPKDDSPLDLSSDFMCPVSKYLDEVLNPLSQAMRFYRNIFNASGGPFYEQNFSCEKIRPHFLHFSTAIGALNPYIHEFRSRCPLGKNTTLITKNIVSTAAQNAYMAYAKFRELHEAKDQKISSATPTSAPSIEWKSLHTAGYLALQNSLLLSQYAESVRWSNAFTTCQSYKLDIGLVSPLMLNDSLTDLAKSLEGSGYTFALPFLNTLPHYYKIPLVDCMITMSNIAYFSGKVEHSNETANLIIRLLIPVIKAGVTYRTYKLNKVPFLKKEWNGEEKVCEVQNFQPDDAYVTEWNGENETIIGRLSPLCYSSKLCKIPEVSFKQAIDPCVVGIITNNRELTSESCHFECNSIPDSIIQREKLFPIITQLLPNKFAITGIGPGALPLVFLECAGQPPHMFNPNSTEGVIMARIPCECEIVHGAKRYPAQKPCDEPLHVEHIIEIDIHRKSRELVDYVEEEPKDARASNITFANPEGNLTSENSSSQPNKTGASSSSASAQQRDCHQPLHCGHAVLWIFMVTVLMMNMVAIWALFRNNLLTVSSILWWRGTTVNIARLENEIPVSNLGSSIM